MTNESLELLIAGLRHRMFSYTEEKQEQATRIIQKAKIRLMPMWTAKFVARLDYPE